MTAENAEPQEPLHGIYTAKSPLSEEIFGWYLSVILE
jgi:hypothetical protein